MELVNENDKPLVSEAHEGKPVVEWAVAAIVVASALLAFLRQGMAATIIISVTAIALGVMRVILRGRSPWKVRSAAFDAFICICLGIGLLITYFSIRLLL